ncbi:MAG: acyl carrier protein [Azospirillum sp.]|nr:acyl carrier protein [Azospirillum sp.]
MAELAEAVIDIIAAKTSVDRAKLEPTARLADLEIASLDVVEIVFALEEKFDIQIPFNANTSQVEFETVGDVIKAVQKVIDEKAA